MSPACHAKSAAKSFQPFTLRYWSNIGKKKKKKVEGTLVCLPKTKITELLFILCRVKLQDKQMTRRYLVLLFFWWEGETLCLLCGLMWIICTFIYPGIFFSSACIKLLVVFFVTIKKKNTEYKTAACILFTHAWNNCVLITSCLVTPSFPFCSRKTSLFCVT